MKKLLFSFLACTAALAAHPMGNFSVSHYTRFSVNAKEVDVTYVLDLAEIPTFELLNTWKLERSSPHDKLSVRASAQAREWLKNLLIEVDGKPVSPVYQDAELVIADGAGNLPIIRIATRARIQAAGGKLDFEDRNFPTRAGWKEVVIHAGAGALLKTVSQPDRDLSKGLTQYPPDPTIAPPQDVRARIEWTVRKPLLVAAAPKPVLAPVQQPHSAPAASSPATLTRQAAPLGSVTRGDYLSKLLHRRQLTLSMILAAIGAAFLLGAAHALTPGHGKSIVAAYLVGSRGTLKHAAFLGGMVTFTHTISVFALGLVTLFLFRYVVPEKLTAALGVLSGLSIVAVGAWMLNKRLTAHTHEHHHDEHHHHDHHEHHHHHHEPHTHTHTHSHVPDEISWTGLAALGASGGLVPCESALVLLLGAIALGRVGLGLVLLLSFSLGLALVLMSIGVLVLYAKNLLPERKRTAASPLFRWLLVASPALVMIVGLLMTGVSLGWLHPSWLIG